MTDNTKLSIRVSSHYLWQLKQIAAMERKTLSELVLAAIAEWAGDHGYPLHTDAEIEAEIKAQKEEAP